MASRFEFLAVGETLLKEDVAGRFGLVDRVLDVPFRRGDPFPQHAESGTERLYLAG